MNSTTKKGKRNLADDFRRIFENKKDKWKEEDKEIEDYHKIEQLKLIDTNNYLKTVKSINRKNQMYIDDYSRRDNSTNNKIQEFNKLLGTRTFYNKKNMNIQLQRFISLKDQIEKEKEEELLMEENQRKEEEEEQIRKKKEAFEKYKLKIAKENNMKDDDSIVLGEKEEYVFEAHKPVINPQQEYNNFIMFKEEYKKKQNAPITMWMSAISTALQNQFGVPINLVTSEEVSKELKGIADPNIDKAFIYNGEVYVNTSIASTNDLLHEHVHLVLGMLKSNPELRGNYERLLNLVLSTDEGRFTMNKLRDRYSELSQMDLAEEVFAKLFSNYIRRHTSLQTDQVFSASEEQLKKLTKSVFNTNIVDVKEFYGKSIISIFGKFNKEVAKMLQSPDIDFGSTKNSRKISAWISKQVADGNIIEKC